MRFTKWLLFLSKFANHTYLRYQIDSGYLAINILQQAYLAMRENDFEQCQGQSVKICPANEAVTDTKAKSCALSLILQKQNVQETCQDCHSPGAYSSLETSRRLGDLLFSREADSPPSMS